MSNVDLQKLILALMARLKLENDLVEEIKSVKDWGALLRMYDAMQKRLSSRMSDREKVLRNHREFAYHADLQRVTDVLSLGRKDLDDEDDIINAFDELYSVVDQLENDEMEQPKWVLRCGTDLVRVLHDINNFAHNGLTECNVCHNTLLNTEHPDFEADVARYESFADFEMHKKRRRCARCEASGESVMNRIEPTILVCGSCGLPVPAQDKMEEIKEFHLMIWNKYHRLL